MIERKEKEPWTSKRTIGLFWIRRFFRIAPLFYVLLAVAFIIGPYLGECRAAIAALWPSSATPLERYNDNSMANLAMHTSFLFGLFPHWSFRSPLPDWSIGLEMEFYLAFPLIMLSMIRLGPIKASLFIVVLCLGFRFLFPSFYYSFQMPSFLLIKLYVFLLGIWIAYSRWHGGMKHGFLIAVGIAMLWLIIDRNSIAFGRVILIVFMFYLMDNGTMPGSKQVSWIVIKLRTILSNRLSVFLGDTSYASYLLHLLIVLPTIAWLITFPEYVDQNQSARFLICVAITLPLIYGGAWLLYQGVEKKGIAIGKHFIQALKKESR